MKLVGQILACAALASTLAFAAAAAEKRAAFFGLRFIDTSPGGQQGDELARLARIEETLVRRLTEEDRFEFVDVAPAAAKLDRISNIAHCNGCDSEIAAALGADVAITGEVQKTSNLILSISVYVRDAETGALVGGGSTDIRGNTDESWDRGISYIIRNRLLKQ
ncbi:DUF3280 domain-containing protein [Rubrimonas cliftonensis]|uniref:DUF2380 domain-containing protein n=1 Tax=Rubrimonas cliftonensis TaxID=89524 RepID=A0A1H4GDV6_9RHOB|nr:DUF3280 domain-containing protein [Rubrimonas cliftonensis]SEB07170.1 Protein of unknown function [Rubrimonas cliftonensis]